MEEIIFIRPGKFEDIVKYMEYVDNDVIIHVNIQDIDKNGAQRVMDFLSGAAFIKEAEIINPGDKSFCVIPKSKKYAMHYKNSSSVGIDPRHDEVEEIIRK